MALETYVFRVLLLCYRNEKFWRQLQSLCTPFCVSTLKWFISKTAILANIYLWCTSHCRALAPAPVKRLSQVRQLVKQRLEPEGDTRPALKLSDFQRMKLPEFTVSTSLPLQVSLPAGTAFSISPVTQIPPLRSRQKLLFIPTRFLPSLTPVSHSRKNPRTLYNSYLNSSVHFSRRKCFFSDNSLITPTSPHTPHPAANAYRNRESPFGGRMISLKFLKELRKSRYTFSI